MKINIATDKKKSPVLLPLGLALTIFGNKYIAIFLMSAFVHFVKKEGGLYDTAMVEDPKYKTVRIIVTVLLFLLFVIRPIFALNRREKRLLRIMNKRMKKQEKRINKRMKKQTEALAAMTGDALGQISGQVTAVEAGEASGKKGKKKRRLRKKSMEAADSFNSRWLTYSELCDILPAKKFAELSNVRKDGLPVYASYDEKKKELFVNIQPPCHSLVVGSTGSGKTTMVVNPSIQILAATASRPSMICTDPKGELLASHGDMLAERGYNVISLNLKDPLHSAKWNPLEGIRDKYREYVTVGREIWERRDPVDESCLVLQVERGRFKEIWYEFRGRAYHSAKAALAEVKKVRSAIFEDIYRELGSVLSAVSPLTDGDDSVKEKNAYILIESIALSLLEDDIGLKDDFTFSNIRNTLLSSCAGSEGIREYFSNRDDDSIAKDHARILLTMTDEMLSGCISEANEKLSLFNDESLSIMTSDSEVSITDIAARPTAVFISSPEDNRDRNRLVGVFLLCLYRGFLRMADDSEQLALPRNMYFILDEFGNCPAINGIENMITTGRSRRIFFLLVIQSFAQLDHIYGDKIAEVIKTNCPTKFCLGSGDSDTCEEFSKLCGETNAAYGEDAGDHYGERRRLVGPTELSGLNTPNDVGNAIVTMAGTNPLRARMTPSYLCPKYYIGHRQDNNSKKKAKVSAIAAILFAAAISALVFGGKDVQASSLSYEGELSAGTLVPEEKTNEKKSANIVKVSSSIFFDKDSRQYIYSIANGEGLVRCNILDGMMVREVVKMDADKNVDLTMYRNGEKVDEPHWDNIWEVGDYVIEATCGNVRAQTILSFSILSEMSGKYRLFTAPACFKIKQVKFNHIERDIKKIKNKKLLSLDEEGHYYILCRAKKLDETYIVELTVDRTPPEIVFSGMDEKGVVKRGGLIVESYDEKDTIDVYLNDEKIDFDPFGFYDTGEYRFDVTDTAGNTMHYEYTVMAYYGSSIRNLIIIFVLMIATLIGYLVRERRNFRVR